MLINIILITVATICLFIILIIIFKHLPQLAAIDLENIPQEKTNIIHQKMIEQRLKRKLQQNVNTFYNKFLMPIGVALKTKIVNLYHQALNLEKHYRKEIKQQQTSLLSATAKQDATKNKLSQAKEFFEQGDFKQAEEAYIEIVGFNSKNIDAYLGLAEVYIALKDLKHAEEIYQHILKIDDDNSATLISLAKLYEQQNKFNEAEAIYKKLIKNEQQNPAYFFELANMAGKAGNNKQALEAATKAVELKGKDPKYLDYLLELSIIGKKKYLALKTFDQLKEVNPDNQKLDDFKKRIAGI